MQVEICGFDMTSAPSRHKPITWARCSLTGDVLTLIELTALETVEAFATVLEKVRYTASGVPWVAGIDAPFGQPVDFLEQAGWPLDWAAYVRHAATLDKHGFAQVIYGVMATRPKGKKQTRRITDHAAGAISPMSLAYVPVGRMFHVLAPVIEASGAAVVPFRQATGPDDQRTLLEAYPALLARAVIGSLPYKDGPKSQQAVRSAHRAALLEELPAYVLRAHGLMVQADATLVDHMRHDERGDWVDALLCAVQAAVAFRLPQWGLPQPDGSAERDAQLAVLQRTEGWILGT